MKRRVRMPRHRAMALAELAGRVESDADVDVLVAAIRRSARAAGGRWWRFGRRTADWLESHGTTGAPPFALFVRGNGKLPFWAWSTLPIVNCPGAGDCVDWCYSLRAWRYPAPFYRQVVNTVLERTSWGRALIRAAWAELPVGETVRLYVDGDLASLDGVAFWFGLAGERSDLAVYGYSKSWHLVTAYAARNPLPSNYWLNLSSGSRFDADAAMRERMEALPITRGAFIAVTGLETKANYKPGKEAELKRHLQELRDKARAQLGVDKVFACPGRCGSCMPQEHACGSARMQNVPIVIAAH